MNMLRSYSPQLALAVLGLALHASAQQSPASAQPSPASAQPSQANAQESHIGDLTGHAAAGALDYKRSCIGCHGVRGNGMGDNATWVEPKPRDFTTGAYKCRSTPTGSLPTDQDIYNSIARGFNTTAMPSWASLTPQTRADLVAYVKTFSPRFAKEKPDPSIVIPPETPVTLDSIKRGDALFQKLECWKCHGPEGRGDGPSASTLTDSKDQPIRPYDFTSGTRFKCGQTNRDLYRIFMTGVDGTPMPSFSDNVTPDQAWDLVHYLRTLQVKRKSEENKILKAAGGKNILVAAAADAAPAPAAAAPAADEPAAAGASRPEPRGGRGGQAPTVMSAFPFGHPYV